MTGLRRLLQRNPALAAWVVACALAMKILVPTGFMPVMAHGAVTIAPCSGTAPAGPMAAMPGMAHHPDKTQHQPPEMPCAFSALAVPTLAGADPLVLAAAIAFIVAFAWRAVVPTPVRPRAHLRPPLRGPPETRALTL
jgi:hypothetical protein